jgi:long-chain fatty acid transport protein
MIGFGAVQDSMGGVGVGATLDACSIISNPAGIADLGSRFDVAGGFFKPSVSYRATGFVATQNAELDSSRGGSPIPAVAYVRPVAERLSAGVGVFGVSGMGVDYALNLYGGPTLTSYMQGRLTPGAAYELTDQLSVGVTANLMMAQMKYDVAAGANQVKHDTASSFGIGATVGVKYSPLERVTLGAAYETRSSFQTFDFDVRGGRDELDFDQPPSATVGVSVAPLDILLLAADLQWIGWSETMGKGLPRYRNDIAVTGAIPFDMAWDDQWVVKLGVQVTPMSGLDLRAGYNYGKMPLDPDRAFENMAFPAVTEHHLTAGAGYRVTEKLEFNVAGMYAPEAEISGANAAAPPAGQGIPSYSTRMSQFQIDVAGAYRF